MLTNLDSLSIHSRNSNCERKKAIERWIGIRNWKEDEKEKALNNGSLDAPKPAKTTAKKAAAKKTAKKAATKKSTSAKKDQE